MLRARRKVFLGVSLIELMICMVILTGVIITFATVFPQGYRLNASNLAQNKAANLAAAVLEEIRALPFGDTGFLNSPGPSSGFTVCSLSGAQGQTAWGSTNTGTSAGLVPTLTFTLPNGSTVNFPRTPNIILINKASDAAAANVFGLPTAPVKIGNTECPVGILVLPQAQDIEKGLPTAGAPNADWMAICHVSIAYQETRGGAKSVVQGHFVTVTSALAQNATQ